MHGMDMFATGVNTLAAGSVGATSPSTANLHEVAVKVACRVIF